MLHCPLIRYDISMHKNTGLKAFTYLYSYLLFSSFIVGENNHYYFFKIITIVFPNY